MFSFFKRKETKTIQVPEWANFFNGKQYNEFLTLIDNYFKKKKVTYSYNDGVIITEDGRFGAHRMGLLNLAQTCNLEKQYRWEKLIFNHFEGFQREELFIRKFKENDKDFSYVKQFIGVRLYDNEYLSSLDESLIIGKQLTDHIFATVVFDFPESIINVQPSQALFWNQSDDNLFELGINNIREKYTFKISQEDAGDFKIWAIHGNHFFVPNIVFDFDKHPKLIGSRGSLVGIPHRNLVMIYPIESLEVVHVLSKFIQIIFKINEEGPGSITNSLYWYYNEELINLPYKINENEVVFTPPEEFESLLNSFDAE